MSKVLFPETFAVRRGLSPFREEFPAGQAKAGFASAKAFGPKNPEVPTKAANSRNIFPPAPLILTCFNLFPRGFSFSFLQSILKPVNCDGYGKQISNSQSQMPLLWDIHGVLDEQRLQAFLF
jgi:hypothetical protein